MTTKMLTGALALGLAIATLGACGDDDDEASDDFCEIGRQLDATEEQPSDDLLDDFVDAAPDEIKDEVERAADAIKDEGQAAFDDPDVVADIDAIEAFEADECRSDDDGDEGDEDDSPVVTDATEDSTGTTTEDSLDDDANTTTTVEDTVSTMTG